MKLRAILLVAVATMLVATVQVARADSIMTPATRDAEGARQTGRGADASALPGKWSFTVADVQGHVGQVIIQIRNGLGDNVAYAGGHPKLGGTFETWGNVPAGAYQLRAFLWGGSGEASVTLSVNTP